MNWNYIESATTVETLIKESFTIPQLVFKHSTRCSISSMAKNRLDAKWDIAPEVLKPYYLDLLSYRALSNEIAERFSVEHESPQVLIIKNGTCIYHASHSEIAVAEIKQQLV